MILDSLNLVYVALSRAINENHIISYTTTKEENFSNLNTELSFFTDLETFLSKVNTHHFTTTYGDCPPKTKKILF